MRVLDVDDDTEFLEQQVSEDMCFAAVRSNEKIDFVGSVDFAVQKIYPITPWKINIEPQN